MKQFYIITLLFLTFGVNAQPFNFDKAKKLIRSKVYESAIDKTFYCGCSFIKRGLKLIPDLKECNYDIRKPKNDYRAGRLEVEHIFSASEMGNQMQCWKRKNGLSGRKNCRKNSPVFNIIEGDMHNLTVAIGEVNLDRSNFKFVEGTTPVYTYGVCPVSIDPKARTVTPHSKRKGDVARAYLYMADRYANYGVKLSRKQRQLYMAWHKVDPPSNREKELERRKAQIQGNSNTWITHGVSPEPYTGHPDEDISNITMKDKLKVFLSDSEEEVVKKAKAASKAAFKMGISKFNELMNK